VEATDGRVPVDGSWSAGRASAFSHAYNMLPAECKGLLNIARSGRSLGYTSGTHDVRLPTLVLIADDGSLEFI